MTQDEHARFSIITQAYCSGVGSSRLKSGDLQSGAPHIAYQTPRVHHCLHMRNSNSNLDYLSIFRCKHSQLPDAQCHVNMACNQWLETWDVAIIHTEGTRICVTVQWMSVDCMTLSPAKLNLIWTVTVNSRVMTGESQTQSWSIASVHPLHYFVAKTQLFNCIWQIITHVWWLGIVLCIPSRYKKSFSS